MALPSTGPISLANVNVELGFSSTATISLNQTSVRTLAGVASGAISMSDLRGKSNVTFSPDGGTSAGTAVYLESTGQDYAEVTITCSQNAVWTYSGLGGDSSISSGSSNFNITFSLATDFNPRTASRTVSATASGVTRYWDVYLEVFGNA